MLWIEGMASVVLVQSRGEMWFMPAVIAILLQHNAMDTGTDCCVVSKS